MHEFATGLKLLSEDNKHSATVITDNNVYVTKGIACGKIIKIGDWFVLLIAEGHTHIVEYNEEMSQYSITSSIIAKNLRKHKKPPVKEEKAHWFLTFITCGIIS